MTRSLEFVVIPLLPEEHEAQFPHGKAIAQVVGAREGQSDLILAEAELAGIGRAVGCLEEPGRFGRARDSAGYGLYVPSYPGCAR